MLLADLMDEGRIWWLIEARKLSACQSVDVLLNILATDILDGVQR